MATVTLSDGRTLTLRPMYISEKVKFIALSEKTNDETPLLDYMQGLGAIIEPAIDPESWTGSVYDMTELQLLALSAEWRTVTEDDALPPENAPDSATK